MRLILASTSPHRRALLQRLRLPFEAVAPTCDEARIGGDAATPLALAVQRAEAKARSLAAADAVVIGSDQVCALDDDVLGKPVTRDRAVAQLQRLAGRSHSLLTAVCVRGGDREHTFVDDSRLTMRALDEAAIVRYVDSDQPLDCAGSYKLESLGIALMERVDSADHTAITGLPLLQLCATLRQFGFALP